MVCILIISNVYTLELNSN
jgi:triacylglycerol lipase